MAIEKDFLYLTGDDVRSLGITTGEILELMNEVFLAKGNGRCEMPAKIGIHPTEDGLCHAMPGILFDRNAMGIKWVAGFTDNPRKRNLPAVTGMAILNDPANGQVLAVMDCTWISLMRTGATCGVSVGALANPDCEVAAVLACGAQVRPGIEAVMIARPGIKKVYLYDLYPEASKRFAEEMGSKLDVEMIPVTDPRVAVSQADVLVTAGPVLLDKSLGYIDPDWIKKGCTIAALDFDTFFNPGFIDSVDKFYTDDIHQYTNFKELVCKKHDKVPIELGDAMVGKYPLRQNHDEIIYSMTIGLSLEDIILADEVYKRALAANVGRMLPR